MGRGGDDELDYRGISLNSAFSSSYGLSTAPISELSVTWGVARVVLQLSPSFKLGEVGIVFFLLPMYFPSYRLATSYAYDFSPPKAHDLAKVSGSCRSVRSKTRAKGLCSVPRVHGGSSRLPGRSRKGQWWCLIIVG